MSSYQRIALFVFFDAIERDLVVHIRSLPFIDVSVVLTEEERVKAVGRLERREGVSIDPNDHLALLPGLDLGDKYSVLLRHKHLLNTVSAEYFTDQKLIFEKSISVRNALMHGRPLTTIEFATGFSIAGDFLKAPRHWPELAKTYKSYTENPEMFAGSAVSLLEEDQFGETLNNLPVPDYDDTGFLPRPALEKELRKKILGRHPVVTLLGEGGNGKTALALQTLYSLIASNDHDFDAIVWVSAKSTRLGVQEIERIENAISDSLGVLAAVANQFEPGDDEPIVRVRRLLEENKVLLVIDNLETVLDDALRDFASEVPGESKLLFTSRVPLGSDLSVNVGDFGPQEARTYVRRLTEAYGIERLKNKSNDQIDRYARRVGSKPLLLKWFALGVLSGLDPDAIVTKADVALKFCMENVVDRLSPSAQRIASCLAVLPIGASAALVQELTDMPSSDVEAGISELLRFALIQRDEKSQQERTYRLGNFTKAYLARFVQADPEYAEGVLKKYRAVEAAYQLQRGIHANNRYDSRFFTVRNRTEVIASKRLKSICSAIYRNELASAESSLHEVRIVNPDYFEVHRVAAMVAAAGGDMASAAASYEAAIELAPDQPQLHVFYAGFLSKYMSDFEQAGMQLDLAMKLDPSSAHVMHEAARNAFYTYNFNRAHEMLEQAKNLPARNLREATITSDLITQLHYREADHLLNNGEIEKLSPILTALLDHIRQAWPRVFDAKHLEHLKRTYRIISELDRDSRFGERQLLDELFRSIKNIEEGVDIGTEFRKKSMPRDQVRTGALKREGFSGGPFGFLRDQFSEETYFTRSAVGEKVWRHCCEGGMVVYRIALDEKGRTYAVEVAIFKQSDIRAS